MMYKLFTTAAAALLSVSFANADISMPRSDGNKSGAFTRETSALGAKINTGGSGDHVMEAERRLMIVRENASEGLVDILNSLNDKDRESDSKDVLDNDAMEDAARATQGISNVKAIIDGKWAATGTGRGKDTSALNWVDRNNVPLVNQVAAALQKENVARISYTTLQKSPLGGAPIERSKIIVAAKASYIMNDASLAHPQSFFFVEIDA